MLRIANCHVQFCLGDFGL